MKASAEELLQSEWDFRNLPESERRACFSYEYGRESPRIREVVDEYRKHSSMFQAVSKRLYGRKWTPEAGAADLYLLTNIFPYIAFIGWGLFADLEVFPDV